MKVAGSVDDTLLTIRRGVRHIPTSLEPPLKLNGKRPRDEDMDSRLHMDTTVSQTKHFVAGTAARPPNARVFTRLLMETYGWPIKYFSSLFELLSIMRDAIEGSLNHVFFRAV